MQRTPSHKSLDACSKWSIVREWPAWPAARRKEREDERRKESGAGGLYLYTYTQRLSSNASRIYYITLYRLKYGHECKVLHRCLRKIEHLGYRDNGYSRGKLVCERARPKSRGDVGVHSGGKKQRKTKSVKEEERTSCVGLCRGVSHFIFHASSAFLPPPPSFVLSIPPFVFLAA